MRELRRYDDISDEISPTFLVRYWPPALDEWSTRAVRDAFFAAPEFPRITSDNVVKAAIASGVSNGILAYVSKLPDGSYVQFAYKTPATADDIAISEDMYIIPAETAEAYLAAQAAAEAARQAEREAGAKKLSNGHGSYDRRRGGDAGETDGPTTAGGDAETATSAGDGEQPADTGGDDPPAAGKQTRIVWEGDLPHQKWMNFYMKALTRFTSDHTVTLHLPRGNRKWRRYLGAEDCRDAGGFCANWGWMRRRSRHRSSVIPSYQHENDKRSANTISH